MVGTRAGIPKRVEAIHQGRGTVFYKALIQPPTVGYQKIGLVVTGLWDGSDFDYAFEYGCDYKCDGNHQRTLMGGKLPGVMDNYQNHQKP